MAELTNGVRPLPQFPVQEQQEEEVSFFHKVTDVTGPEFTYLNGGVEAIGAHSQTMRKINEQLRALGEAGVISPGDFNTEATRYNETLASREAFPQDLSSRAQHLASGIRAVIARLETAEGKLQICVDQGLPGEVFATTIPTRLAAVQSSLDTLREEREKAEGIRTSYPELLKANMDVTKHVEGKLNNNGFALNKARKAANWMASWARSAATPAPVDLKVIAAVVEEEAIVDTNAVQDAAAVVFGPSQKPADHVEPPAPAVFHAAEATDKIVPAPSPAKDGEVFEALTKGTAPAPQPLAHVLTADGTYFLDGVEYNAEGNILVTAEVDEDGDVFKDAKGPKLGRYRRPKGEQSKSPYYTGTWTKAEEAMTR